ncbi:hypothetical protein CfE428DRAFT_2633 [Chthoniobacter flavus Ellin428]|uniref:Uncharacterized protein n=1 Tax=Chthoniobacter flavus Ellin428 TaxID=497964 RepID=B4D132_9BACT|nr:hypothetical protein [Chthoniobacter flavus]EDY20044.1 hypothetical protein CfE428DRAFT_2633 [Chthoniobacter flavus Ellin428]
MTGVGATPGIGGGDICAGWVPWPGMGGGAAGGVACEPSTPPCCCIICCAMAMPTAISLAKPPAPPLWPLPMPWAIWNFT